MYFYYINLHTNRLVENKADIAYKKWTISPIESYKYPAHYYRYAIIPGILTDRF